MDKDTFVGIASSTYMADGVIYDLEDTGELDQFPTQLVGNPMEIIAAISLMTAKGETLNADEVDENNHIIVSGDYGTRVVIKRVAQAGDLVASVGKRVPSIAEIQELGIREGMIHAGPSSTPAYDPYPGQGNRVADVQSNPPGYGSDGIGMYL